MTQCKSNAYESPTQGRGNTVRGTDAPHGVSGLAPRRTAGSLPGRRHAARLLIYQPDPIPIGAHNLISFRTISNVVRHLYGEMLLGFELTPPTENMDEKVEIVWQWRCEPRRLAQVRGCSFQGSGGSPWPRNPPFCQLAGGRGTAHPCRHRRYRALQIHQSKGASTLASEGVNQEPNTKLQAQVH